MSFRKLILKAGILKLLMHCVITGKRLGNEQIIDARDEVQVTLLVKKIATVWK
jgi:hypothetical protein